MTTGSTADHIRRRTRHAIPDHLVNTAHFFARWLRRHANICERKLQYANDFRNNLCESVELQLTCSDAGSIVLVSGTSLDATSDTDSKESLK